MTDHEQTVPKIEPEDKLSRAKQEVPTSFKEPRAPKASKKPGRWPSRPVR